MVRHGDVNKYIQDLEARNRHLEEVYRWTIDALDLVVSFGEFQSGGESTPEPAALFSLTRQHLKRLMPLNALAFMMVSETDMDFVLTDCEPEADRDLIQREVDVQIEERTFAWALYQNRATTVPSRHLGRSLILHPLATRTRVLGMFVGVLDKDKPMMTDVSSELLSVILSNTAHALENSSLYREIQEHNRNLETTIRKRTEELRDALKAAEKANEAKSQFLASMSHEIRTPLNGAIGMLNLLLNSGLDEKQHTYAKNGLLSAELLLGVINDILDFSKIEAGRLDLETVEFDLRKTVEEVMDLFALKAHGKGLELCCLIEREVPAVLEGDPVRLRQVLINLVGNALKFTEKGEVALRVAAEEIKEDEALVRFSVRDTGIGIPEERKDRLFKPFSQVDASMTRRFGGTGLGLVISEQLTRMMGGEIGVESREGRGSTFYFTARFSLPHALSEYAAPDLRNLRVLVVEENDTVRGMIEEMLASYSCDVQALSSWDRALKVVESRPCGLVIADRMPPGEDGPESSGGINAHPGLEGARFIMLARYGRGEEAEAEKDTGVSVLLERPLKESRLVEAIMEVAAGKSRESQAEEAAQTVQDCLPRGFEGARVLLVEDNHLNQQVAKEMLEAAGLEVEVAANGMEALEVAGNSKFDVVLMDVQMPRMDGYEATRLMRENPSLKGIPIIAMTAHAMKGDRDRCYDAGMNDYLTKPIDPDKLFGALERWLGPLKVDTREDLAPRPARPESGHEGGFPFDLPGVDVESALQRLGGNEGLLKTLLVEFHTDYADVSLRVRDALAKGERELARRLVHTLKGVSGNLSMDGLHAASLELEKAIKSDGTEALGALFGDFEAELSRVLESVGGLAGGSGEEIPAEGAGPLQDAGFEDHEIEPLLRELGGLLRENSLDAGDLVEEIKHRAARSGLPEELRSLEERITSFDFEGAHRALTRLAKTWNVYLKI